MKNAASAPDPREFIIRYIKYLPWVLLSLLVMLTVAFIKIRYSTPIYHVQASLLINQDDVNNTSKDERFQEMFMTKGSTNVANELQFLRSTSIMERVVRALDLEIQYFNIGKIRTSLVYPDAPFYIQFLSRVDSLTVFQLQVTVLNDTQYTLNKEKTIYLFGQDLEYQGMKVRIIRNLSVNMNLFSMPVFIVSRQPAHAVAMSMLEGLSITEPSDETTILLLSYNGENVNLGRDILNKMMKVHDSLIIEDKNRISANTIHFIDAQLDALKGQLDDVEVATKKFMVTNDVFDIASQSKSFSENLEEISRKNGEVQVKLSVLDLLSSYINKSKTSGTVPVPALLGIEEPALAQAVAEYNKMQLQKEANLRTTTPDNPLILQMNSALEKLRNDILQVLKNVRESYLIAGNTLQKNNSENQNKLKSMPGKSMQLLNIQRQQKILEDLYSFLLMKKLESSISAAATVSNSRVIEPPSSPSIPINPDKKSIYLFNVLLGLIIPVGLIVLKEFLKDKVTDRADVEKRIQVPILGEVSHSDEPATLVVSQNSRRFIAEQFRSIRSNLKYVVAKFDKPTILVTSSFSGEGKSFISTNIGAVIALTGKKTVIMEFDIRKPKIMVGLDLKRKQGITNYIIGNVKFEDLVLPVQDVDNLYVIPCGPIPPNPAELLLDEKLDQLMEEVKKNFEVIIMDTAPVGLVADAYNLAKYANCSLFIVRQGYTFRKQLYAIEELFLEKRLPSVSVLLNDVKIEGGYLSGGYYGGYGYGYGYRNGGGYFEENEERKRKSAFKRIMLWFQRLFSTKA